MNSRSNVPPISLNVGSRRQFNDYGMAVIEQALPELIAEDVRMKFQGAEYERIEQIREHHYEHVFKTDSPYLPKAGEHYIARFWRSPSLESGKSLNQFFENYIRPIVQDISGTHFEKVDLRAYKMTDGDQYRVHIDDYAGPVGFIYYLSKNWKWDWGGILMTADGDNMVPSLPKFNQLILLNHGKRRPPHMVTPIASFAAEPRYVLVGFLS
ncbi:2OG-Fe(II) oxygenase [Candidatus Nitronereus thalassa]|uniref:2OG-Fe(II) oxygenase n=1 Tax=Candidatus Nitronereus thalassa TaxID=3020898 RepID=A0ABU3K5K5_9BACT|nr:2OG-Fe(II) oxygenase [Candidatus Nitronereus thalassa]MDT7041658.1 2OG-Fe(II) oxygenase [Candidatus Nitronereus thalassa]